MSTPVIHAAFRKGDVGIEIRTFGIAKTGKGKARRRTQTSLADCPTIWLDGYTPVPNLRGKTQIKEFSSFPKLEELPLAEVAVQAADFLISAVLISGMFAIMYKVLPDTPIRWRDVATGALMATGLFEGGKYLIALYIGQTEVASSFGAAGALIVLLLWIFYSTLIFLLGAEFTRAWTHVYGSRCDDAATEPRAPSLQAG